MQAPPPSWPPFDAAAHAAAAALAARAGRPNVRDEGLLAIHAVLQRHQHPQLFPTNKRAWEAYESNKQLFQEYKKLCTPLLPSASPHRRRPHRCRRCPRRLHRRR